jgi:hypothetical protein
MVDRGFCGGGRLIDTEYCDVFAGHWKLLVKVKNLS